MVQLALSPEPQAPPRPELPSIRAVYLKPPPRPMEGHGARLILVFLSTFTLTTLGSLGIWVTFRVLVQLLSEIAPVARIEEGPPSAPLERPLPAPVPVPVSADPPAPAPAPAKARSEATAPTSPVVAAADPETVPPEARAEVPAEEWIEAVPFVLAVLEPPAGEAESSEPPRKVAPAAALALAGTYAGRGDGRALSLELRILPDGLLSATIVRPSPSGELSVEAHGTYELQGAVATIVLMERSVAQPVAYSGTVSSSGAEGRMTQSGRNLGKFSLQK